MTEKKRIETWKENHNYREKYRDPARAPRGWFEVKLVAENNDHLIYRQTNTDPHGPSEYSILYGVSTVEEVETL